MSNFLMVAYFKIKLDFAAVELMSLLSLVETVAADFRFDEAVRVFLITNFRAVSFVSASLLVGFVKLFSSARNKARSGWDSSAKVYDPVLKL